MNPTVSMDPDVRSATTLIYDFLSFGFTTIYLSVVNNQILSSFGNYFGFLSINAKYQQYWTAFSMAQHIIVNQLGITTTWGKLAFAIFGIIKIAGTLKYVSDLWNNFYNTVNSWPEFCKDGQKLFIIQIGLRAIAEIFNIINYLIVAFKIVSEKVINYIGYFDKILTSLQLLIFLIQT